MKAFITGGTGFIGSHLADTLLEHEDYEEVRCLVRNLDKWLSGKAFVRISGDLHDLPALENGLEGIDVVFHIAGVVKAPDWQQFKRANVEATENLVRVAQKKGVKKLVILSSLAAAGPSTMYGRPITEDDPMLPISMYGKSKKEMEEMIHRTVNGDISVTILRPSAVYGPREDQIYLFFKMVDKHICPIVGDGKTPRISMVYVMDVIKSMLCAAGQPKPGVDTYFISGENLHTWSEIRETSATVLGKKTIPLYIKPAFVKKIAAVIEKAASFFGAYPVINREKANEMISEWTCSIRKAEMELDFHPEYSLGEGISRTIRWYKMNKWL